MDPNQELEGLLGESERIIEHSERKPRVFYGIIYLTIGALLVFEFFSSRNSSYLFLIGLLIGLVFLYIAAWMLFICRNEYVCVTNKRVIYRKSNYLGKFAGVKSFDLRDIEGVRLFKMNSMFTWQRHGGEVFLDLRDKKKYAMPSLSNGQYILDAIRQECGIIAAADREAAEREAAKREAAEREVEDSEDTNNSE